MIGFSGNDNSFTWESSSIKASDEIREEAAVYDFSPETNILWIENIHFISEEGLASSIIVDLRNLILSCKEEVWESSLAKSIVWKLDLEEPAFLRCNPIDVRSVILYLFSNAVNYNKKQGSIYVSLRESENGYLVRIRDTGIGISEEKLAKIFEIRPKESSGSGVSMALFLCKEILEEMGGWIQIESKESEGTTVSFWVPKDL